MIWLHPNLIDFTPSGVHLTMQEGKRQGYYKMVGGNSLDATKAHKQGLYHYHFSLLEIVVLL